jgi:hypothetical protein
MVSRNLPFEYFILSNVEPDGPVVGFVADRPVRGSVVDGHGRRYRFSGLARRDGSGRLDVEDLRTGEWIVLPDLVYTRTKS